jgi:hypothetical protein
MWPFTKRKRREAEQDAEYQAFLAAHHKPKPAPRPANPSQPNGHWKWDAVTRQRMREQLEPVHRAYQGSAVSYGPVDELGISCAPSIALHDRYPDQAND